MNLNGSNKTLSPTSTFTIQGQTSKINNVNQINNFNGLSNLTPQLSSNIIGNLLLGSPLAINPQNQINLIPDQGIISSIYQIKFFLFRFIILQ